MERLPAHVKAEAELPVGSQGRDGQRGGKKIRRKSEAQILISTLRSPVENFVGPFVRSGDVLSLF